MIQYFIYLKDVFYFIFSYRILFPSCTIFGLVKILMFF
jgi:hypothetical protein